MRYSYNFEIYRHKKNYDIKVFYVEHTGDSQMLEYGFHIVCYDLYANTIWRTETTRFFNANYPIPLGKRVVKAAAEIINDKNYRVRTEKK